MKGRAKDWRAAVMGAAGEVRLDEPMARHTTWRVGGAVDLFYAPAGCGALADFLARLDPAVPVLWSGLGSNLLVRDGGLRGVVVSLYKGLTKVARDGAAGVCAEAGAPCNRVARRAAAFGLRGAEFLCGIPGTVGGALAMNAGAFGGETWNLVSAVRTMDRGGRVRRRDAAEFEAGYRELHGPVADGGEWFIGAKLRLRRGDGGESAAQMAEILAKRNATQPAQSASAGSVFRNPAGDFAARLIDSAGLKGRAVGGAAVSSLHANFIVNTGGATAADVESLIQEVRAAVFAAHGVRLAPEVRIVGEAE